MPEKKSRPPVHRPPVHRPPVHRPPVHFHPVPSRPVASPAEQKGLPPRKGGDLKGVSPLVYSDLEDLPADYYHGMWRERDSNAFPNPEMEREARKLAEGWPRSLFPTTTCRTLIRSDEYAYKQSDGYCDVVCAVFVYFRRLGLPPALAIHAMKNRWIEKQLPVWEAQYEATLLQEKYGTANLSSKLLSKVMWAMDKVQRSGKLPALVVSRPISSNHIWTQHLIGTYPATAMPAQRLLHIKTEYNYVATTPQASQSQSARTMQQALFSSYQPPRTTEIPLRWGSFESAKAMRSALPIVKIIFHMDHPLSGKVDAHAILADFTDPRHPGIFDPNFGWMEPRQGHCYISFELALQTLWEKYTKHNLGHYWQGVKHHRDSPIPQQRRMAAYQIYEQSAVD